MMMTMENCADDDDSRADHVGDDQNDDNDKKMMMSRKTMTIQELVTVGMLRSPELPPPPAWNDDDKTNTSDVTFQSCFVSTVVVIAFIDDDKMLRPGLSSQQPSSFMDLVFCFFFFNQSYCSPQKMKRIVSA